MVLFATVQFFMPHQAGFLDKALVAVIAGVGLLTSVRSFVGYQMPFLNKAFLTNTADKRLFAIV